MTRELRRGNTGNFYLVLGAAVRALVVLGVLLYQMGKPKAPTFSQPPGAAEKQTGETPSAAGVSEPKSSQTPQPKLSTQLFMYCAAGCRLPVEKVMADYEREYGIAVQLLYGGSNTLLSQIEVAKTGDLFLAADDSYVRQAQERGLLQETLPLALLHPVIIVRKGNPQSIRGIDDLTRLT